MEVMNCSVLHTEGKVVLDSVLVGYGKSNVGRLEAHLLRKLPLDLDLIIGLDVIMLRGLQILPPVNEKSVTAAVKFGMSYSVEESREKVRQIGGASWY